MAKGGIVTIFENYCHDTAQQTDSTLYINVSNEGTLIADFYHGDLEYTTVREDWHDWGGHLQSWKDYIEHIKRCIL